MYYTSKACHGVEIWYPRFEKLALAPIKDSRRMKLYFQGHTIIVYTDLLLRHAINKPEKSGTLMAWVVALEEYDIQ